MKLRLLPVLLVLVGCASNPVTPAQQAEIDRTIPTCSGEADCKAKWEAAQLWIVHHSGYKIQTATDVLLETYNPDPYDAKLAVRVTKEPQGNGSYRILVYVWCNNAIGCVPNGVDAALDFNQSVGRAKP